MSYKRTSGLTLKPQSKQANKETKPNKSGDAQLQYGKLKSLTISLAIFTNMTSQSNTIHCIRQKGKLRAEDVTYPEMSSNKGKAFALLP